ncbi:MAG: ABC transporter permease [Holophagales bacterium]|nr:ABC transporter permease [Holophagales bacterium]MYH24096.1 ABC transporter permease [Holophagales bacterium]
MIRFVLRRLLAAAVLFLIVLTLAFAVVALAPGDPMAPADPRIPPEQAERLRALYGLDQPLPVQYLRWLGAVALHWDWGQSYRTGQPVAELLFDALPPTLLLAGAALLAQYLLGIGLGLIAACRPNSRLDLSVRVASLVVYALPTFWVGLMAVLVVAVGLGLAPAGGMTSAAAFELGPAAAALDVLAHLWLPALVLGLSMAGDIARYTRSSLIEFLATESGRAARARGLSETRILLVHGLAHAAPRLLQLASVSAPLLLSGAVVAEVVFAWPGLGTATLLAIQSRDIPVVLAATAYGAALVIAASLVADLLLTRLDPRLRAE